MHILVLVLEARPVTTDCIMAMGSVNVRTTCSYHGTWYKIHAIPTFWPNNNERMSAPRPATSRRRRARRLVAFYASNRKSTATGITPIMQTHACTYTGMHADIHA